jgi:hypothetical protein
VSGRWGEDDGAGGRADATARERAVFAVLTLLLSAAALAPVWTNAFPPLQDYPYHLAQVAVLLAGDGPASPYAAHFTTDLTPRPYVGFYLFATALARAMPIELAGRLALSVPLALWAWLLIGGLRRRGAPPWGALVWLPLTAGLSWHLGFVVYLWSLPLLGLALEDQARLAHGEGGRGCGLRLALWIGGLFLTHPFTYLAYLGLGALRLVCEPTDAVGRRRAVVAWCVAACAFAAWYALAGAGRGAAGPEGVHWLPLMKSAELLTLPFTGMRGFADLAWMPLAVWGGLAVAIAIAAWRGGGVPRFAGIALALCTVLCFAAPFRVGHYSYVNARLPEIALLCLGLAAGGLRFTPVGRGVLVVGVAALLAFSGLQQRRVALELAEVAPLLERIPAGSAVLPLVFDDDSPELEPSAFDPHLHVHHYFHVRRGGGVSPYFFPHPLAPVRYREGSPPAAPPQQRPSAYRPERHPGWDHLLVRAAPPRFLRRLAGVAEEVAISGRWRLFVQSGSGGIGEAEEPPAVDR